MKLNRMMIVTATFAEAVERCLKAVHIVETGTERRIVFIVTHLNILTLFHMKKELLIQILEELIGPEQQGAPDLGHSQGAIRIVILQRGWIYVGKFYSEGNECRLENASCIRTWGTSKGLGELASNGPTDNTKLDPAPTVRFHRLTIVATIDCDEKAWKGKI